MFSSFFSCCCAVSLQMSASYLSLMSANRSFWCLKLRNRLSISDSFCCICFASAWLSNTCRVKDQQSINFTVLDGRIDAMGLARLHQDSCDLLSSSQMASYKHPVSVMPLTRLILRCKLQGHLACSINLQCFACMHHLPQYETTCDLLIPWLPVMLHPLPDEMRLCCAMLMSMTACETQGPGKSINVSARSLIVAVCPGQHTLAYLVFGVT